MSGVILSDVFKWSFAFSPFHLFLSTSIIILVFLYYHNINKKLATVTAVRPLARFGAIDLDQGLVKNFLVHAMQT